MRLRIAILTSCLALAAATSQPELQKADLSAEATGIREDTKGDIASATSEGAHPSPSSVAAAVAAGVTVSVGGEVVAVLDAGAGRPSLRDDRALLGMAMLLTAAGIWGRAP